MSKIHEKVKDLIEVRSFDTLSDFYEEPRKTLDNYCFTDITAGLMASWLDDLGGDASPAGSMKALAGYRGVGKSHFLAAFGAIIANPELRQNIPDAHVVASAQRLLRRGYPVINVQRGTQSCLLEELRTAVGKTFSAGLSEIPKNFQSLLDFCEKRAGDMPCVIVIDTAADRKAKVARDDGEFLGELAGYASRKKMFVAVALDDDITDADGINAAITKCYRIDYLDQEHLYRIVDTHIFPKNRRNQEVISTVYEYFRRVLPGFRWSDRRFIALYPLHPLILEITPFIRLYAQDFALLGFASESGRKILGRPANSLIGLDEVFDNTENTLRDDPNLADAFGVYDRIAAEVVSLVPVMDRLQAKLILKALFVLSLEGDGVTADEISAAMLIVNEKDPKEASKGVSELLETFVSVFPEDLWRTRSAEGVPRFSLKVSAKDKLNHALEGAASDVPDEVLPGVLMRLANDKFSDLEFATTGDSGDVAWSDCETHWRGSQRKIRLFWNWHQDEKESLRMLPGPDPADLEVFITEPDRKIDAPGGDLVPSVAWTPSALSNVERSTLKKLHLLTSDPSFSVEYPEQVGAAGHKHALAAAGIFERSFLKEAVLIAEGADLSLEAEALQSGSIADLFAEAVDAVFESKYPEHPVFDQPFGMYEVSRLVSDLFSGARVSHGEVQQFAQNFAVPLGLVRRKEENLILQDEEGLFGLHLVEKVLSLVAQQGDGTVSLEAVHKRLGESPFGLAKEARNLILAALVAHGKIEFVTSKGDRINRRSLDLRIIWEDIAGIAKPEDVVYEAKRLTFWAGVLTGVEKVETIDIAQDRKRIKQAIRKWLADFKDTAILGRFEDLPADILNTKIWYTAVKTGRSFGEVADTLDSFLAGSLSLEEALQGVGNAFSDSVDEFRERETDLLTLVNFVEGARLRSEVEDYLLLSEFTDDPGIESLRDKLDGLLLRACSSPSAETNTKLETTWIEFRKAFGGYYAGKHDEVMSSDELTSKLDEIAASDEFWEFSLLAGMPVFRQEYGRELGSLFARGRSLKCAENASDALLLRPFCGCGFNLGTASVAVDLPKKIISVMMYGAESYKRTLAAVADHLIGVLKEITKKKITDVELHDTARGLIEKFEAEVAEQAFTTEELHFLRQLLTPSEGSPVIKTGYPQIAEFISAEDLEARIGGWLSELPSEPIFLEL